MEGIIQNKGITFHYNPFGGLSEEDIPHAIVPRFDLAQTVVSILKGTPGILELVGQKGRGKTTHLRLLHQLAGNYPIFLLNKGPGFEEIENDASEIVFVDSIHHLSFGQRIRLYKNKKTLVLTTHRSKYLEYRFAGRPSNRITLKGINPDILKGILANRIHLASTKYHEEIMVKDATVQELVLRFKDDYRGILNHLYDQFQAQQ